MRSGVSLRMLVTLSLWGLLATTAVLPSWYAFDNYFTGSGSDDEARRVDVAVTK